MVVQAWVDESIHLDTDLGGIYVLAATVVHVDEALDGIREELRSLIVGPSRRLHWHSELATTRSRIVETIVRLPLEHVAVVRIGVDPKGQERARRKCLERLLFELSERVVERVWLESRTERLNRHDVKLVDAARNTGAVTSMQIGFARPLEESMLWLPDAVAGAVALARKGRGAHYRQRLRSVLEEIEV